MNKEEQYEALSKATNAYMHHDTLPAFQSFLQSVAPAFPLLQIPGAVRSNENLEPGKIFLVDGRVALSAIGIDYYQSTP